MVGNFRHRLVRSILVHMLCFVRSIQFSLSQTFNGQKIQSLFALSTCLDLPTMSDHHNSQLLPTRLELSLRCREPRDTAQHHSTSTIRLLKIQERLGKDVQKFQPAILGPLAIYMEMEKYAFS